MSSQINATDTIAYTLEASNPAAHIFTVSVSVSVAHPDPTGQSLRLPAWIPGSYMIRDFARNIISIKASAGGRAIELQKTDKSSWMTPPGLSDLRVEYEVYAWDLSVRAAHLDNTHGFFNGTSVFLSVVGQEHKPCVLELPKLSGEPFSDWRLATSLGTAPIPSPESIPA